MNMLVEILLWQVLLYKYVRILDWIGLMSLVSLMIDQPDKIQSNVWSIVSGCIGYKKMLGTRRSRSEYKAIHFESIISTNGIQHNIHYKTEQLITKNKTVKKKGKQVQDEQSCDTITSDMFDCWIAEHKTLISVDPGHKDLIAIIIIITISSITISITNNSNFS